MASCVAVPTKNVKKRSNVAPIVQWIYQVGFESHMGTFSMLFFFEMIINLSMIPIDNQKNK